MFGTSDSPSLCFPQEFEVIAQIKLLQSACNSYCLTPEPVFLRWFKSQAQLSEEERYCCRFSPSLDCAVILEIKKAN